MNLRLLDFLLDPNDFQSLDARVFEGDDREIREGVLINARSRRWYPIRDGIPSVFCDAFRIGALKTEDDEFSAQYADELDDVLHPENAHEKHHERARDFHRISNERRARDAQSEAYDRMLSLKILDLFELPAYRRAMIEYSMTPNDLPLLEAGCGTGRFTDLLAQHASEVVAADMSRDSILRNRARHAGKTAAPVHYLHADLTHLPLKEKTFGRIAHIAVYEHIPSRAMRQQFVEHAHRVLVEDGTFLLSAYRFAGLTKLLAKNGEHDGGIPFHRFAPAELIEEIAAWFDVKHRQENVGVYMTMVVATPRR